jgi:hypothetical protein
MLIHSADNNNRSGNNIVERSYFKSSHKKFTDVRKPSNLATKADSRDDNVGLHKTCQPAFHCLLVAQQGATRCNKLLEQPYQVQ